MPVLHLLREAHVSGSAVPSCLTRMSQDDSILLLENGVYLCMKGGLGFRQLSTIAERGRLYVLGPDLAARGLALDDIGKGVTVVDYAGFVDLTVKSKSTITW
jgi:tRNA 2-thiouridine synthesizing protein B